MKVTECRLEIELHPALSEWVIVKNNNEGGFYWYTTKNYNRFEHGAEPLKSLTVALNDVKSYEKESLRELGLWDYKTGKAKI